MNMKRIFNMGMVMILLVTSLAVSQPAGATAPEKFTPRIAPGAQTAPGEVVVTFANSADKTLVEKIEQAVDTANTAGGEVTRLSMDGDAVIRVDGDTTAALDQLNSQPDVLYAEPNYIYSAPISEASSDGDNSLNSEYVFRGVTPSSGTDWKSIMAVPNSTIMSMVAMGTYPTDKYLTVNQGWFNVGADIVWPNTTASANICEVDTGVDRLHPDFKYVKSSKTYYRVIAGYDYVNADTDPSDGNGHGTHVAGIMVAVNNNGTGVSGVSTGNVVAMKALDAQGVGTNFDVAAAIRDCANRTDIRVINLSLGGPAPSEAIQDALLYATTPTTDDVPPAGGAFAGLKGKGKLVVVAAGNNGSSTPTYPAAYAADPLFPDNRILSVGATGKLGTGDVDYNCAADTTNFGDWVTVMAPGYDIYSTTPYDKPFYQNYYGHVATRYDYMSGTSMAAAFVSASAARHWGYKPLETNEEVGTAVVTRPPTATPPTDVMDTSCTPVSLHDVYKVNVAYLMDRAALRVSVFDAAAGTPLNGATLRLSFLNDTTTAYRYGTISPQASTDPLGLDIDPTRIYTYYFSVTDILDIPTVSTKGAFIPSYSLAVNKSGYTVGYQSAFQQDEIKPVIQAGTMSMIANGAVPPKSADFNVVLGWHEFKNYAREANSIDDLDLYIWLPGPAPVDPNQPATFIVGYNGDAGDVSTPPTQPPALEGDSYGSMIAFPFTRLKREGGFLDGGPKVEMTTVAKRLAHGSVAANAALPYYAGAYTVYATDYGQTIDHDNDGCGDNFGYDYSPTYDATADPDCPPTKPAGTLGIPLLGTYFTPYMYMWKDGVVKYFVDGSNGFGAYPANDPNNKHWWKGFAFTSTLSGTAPTYVNYDFFDNGSAFAFFPYSPSGAVPGSRLETFNFGK